MPDSDEFLPNQQRANRMLVAASRKKATNERTASSWPQQVELQRQVPVENAQGEEM
jgi:hypothetical protein